MGAGAAAAAAEDPAADLGGLPSLLQLTGLLAGGVVIPRDGSLLSIMEPGEQQPVTAASLLGLT